jgi:hypothetical protein
MLVLSCPLIEDVRWFTAIISAGTFWFAVSGPCSYTIVIDMGGRHVATVFSLMNLAGNVGAFVFPLVVPRMQTTWGWNSVIIAVGGMFLAGALCWLLLNPNGSIFEQSLARRSRGGLDHDSR